MSSPQPPSHWAKDNSEEDRVESLIKKSGCWDQHLSVVDCMVEKGDWRQCQAQLSAFKECMSKAQPQQYSKAAKKEEEKKN